MTSIRLSGRDEVKALIVPGLPQINRYTLHSQRKKRSQSLSIHYDVPGQFTLKYQVLVDGWDDERVRDQFDAAAIKRIADKLAALS